MVAAPLIIEKWARTFTGARRIYSSPVTNQARILPAVVTAPVKASLGGSRE